LAIGSECEACGQADLTHLPVFSSTKDLIEYQYIALSFVSVKSAMNIKLVTLF
jgi:hypothetical protein